MSRLCAPILLACSLVALPAAAQKKAPPATAALQRGQQDIDRALERLGKADDDARAEARDALRDAVNGFIDFAELARRALGSHWEDRTPEERSEFQQTMKSLVEAAYLARVKERASYEVRYDGQQALAEAKGEVLVRTTLVAEKAEIPVEYRLYRSGGKWLVYDVVTDGLSLLENYRSQFNQIIKKKGFDGLLSTLQRKRDEIEQTSADDAG